MNIDTFLSAHATPFGSRMWSTPTPNSDFDYLIHTDRKAELVNLLSNLGIEYTTRDSAYLLSGLTCQVHFGQIEVSVSSDSYYPHHINTITLINRLHDISPSDLDSKFKRVAIYATTLALFAHNTKAPSPAFPIEHFPELYI